MNIRLLNTNTTRKRMLCGLMVFVLIFVIYSSVYQSNSVACYFDQDWKDGKTLPNVVENLKLRSHNAPKNIFFHETSCSDGIIRLNSRQACAIESSGKSSRIIWFFVTLTHETL